MGKDHRFRVEELKEETCQALGFVQQRPEVKHFKFQNVEHLKHFLTLISFLHTYPRSSFHTY